MTERLYYNDPTLLEFEATIQSVEQIDNRWRTILDRSAFYPTSGGQLHDTGLLGNSPVIDVVDTIENAVSVICHITDTKPGSTGERVTGKVDANRRTRNRQAHTAQHILSQAFVSLCGYETVSVHLGVEYAAVELDTATVSPEELSDALQYTNRQILANFPIEILFVDASEIDSIPLRKPPQRSGTLRIIKIGELDWSACGGTHCSRTGEIRLILLLGTEKLRAHTVVKFVAGELALKDYEQRATVTEQLSQKLTCAVSDIPNRVGRLQSDIKTARGKLTKLQKELLPVFIEKLASKSKTSNGLNYLVHEVTEFDAKLVDQLASGIARKINGLAIMLHASRLVLATGSESGLKAAQLVSRLTAKSNLRGGGNDKLAQIGNISELQFQIVSKRLVELAKDR